MGWSFQHKPREQSAEDFLIDNFSYTLDSGREVKVVACAIVRGMDGLDTVAYMAVDRGDGRVTALVCLLAENPRDEFNFGYKDMPESSHPYSYRCPKRILDLLTEPAPNQDAEEWRAICRKNLLRVN